MWWSKKYILFENGGKWGRTELQMDAALMEDYYNRAMETEDEAARQLLLEQACRLYGGEFPSCSVRRGVGGISSEPLPGYLFQRREGKPAA